MEKLFQKQTKERMKNSSLFIVIPCHNGRKYIKDLIYSLNQGEVKPNSIIIIDNGSTDGTADLIQQEFPEVRLFSYKESLGYAKASNLGIKKALEDGPDYIFLLNQDIICKKDTIKNLIDFAEIHQNFFILSPLILCWPEKDLIQTSGDMMHFLGFGYSGNYKLPLSEFKLKPFTYASGAAMFFNAQKLKKIGFFDEDFVMYHEDADLCLRAQLKKEKYLLVPQAQLYHRYKEEISDFRWFWSERNRILTLIKFYKLPTLLLIAPLFKFMELGVLGFSLFDGWLNLKIKSYQDIYKLLPKILKKRKIIQKERKISDKEFLKYFVDTFHFEGFTHPLLKYIVNPIFGFAWKILYSCVFW